jgi:sec-independent protein translocase protein TatB
MFSVPHLVVLFIVVLVFFGPHKLPELARGLGKLMAEFRKASNDFKMAFEEEMRTIERQAREAEWKKSQEAAEAKRQADLATTSSSTAVADPAMEGKILPEPAANSASSHPVDASEPQEPIVTPVNEAVARDSFQMSDERSAPAAAELPAEQAASSDSDSGDPASARSDNSPSGNSSAAGPIHDQPHDQRQPA